MRRRAHCPFFCPALLLTLIALIAGCTSPAKRVAQRVDALQAEWQTNLAHQAQLPERILDWPAALAELRAHNLKLRQAATELTNAQEAVRQVFRDLTPTLNFRAGVTKRIADIPQVGPQDVNLSIDSIFNIPGLVSFGARLYTVRLYQLRAEAAYALTEREQIVALYRLFWAAQDIQQLALHVENQRRTAQAYETVDPFTGQLLLTEVELRELAGAREGENLQQRASELLGNYRHRWGFATNGLPPLRYDLEPLPLEDTNRVAQLQIRLAAIESEAARAQQTGIKLRYWPELNIFVTGPPVYQRAFGQERFWDANEVRASADLYWWIDTRGHISRQLRQTRRQQAMQEERLRQETLALMDRLIFAQGLLQAAQEKERDLQNQLLVLEAVPPAQNLPSLQKYAMDYQATADQLRGIQRELAELNALFWFVDEEAWSELAPLRPLAAARR